MRAALSLVNRVEDGSAEADEKVQRSDVGSSNKPLVSKIGEKSKSAG